uniref:Uncharacterized protein n=1 Tax=Spongospora subterranea TaxID=70186 RepID=A0A0H5QKK8_9EUKA|eukprot:CRZ01841.1 hypothetical protein [Spongospora subterranea]
MRPMAELCTSFINSCEVLCELSLQIPLVFNLLDQAGPLSDVRGMSGLFQFDQAQHSTRRRGSSVIKLQESNALSTAKQMSTPVSGPDRENPYPGQKPPTVV